mmetsp:Transcript_25593/g.29396  ORF Transcript_25593/g.29396 Transcript_25593/m.29396 type:complete len:139 (+) Transcript_25593:39-455(+)
MDAINLTDSDENKKTASDLSGNSENLMNPGKPPLYSKLSIGSDESFKAKNSSCNRVQHGLITNAFTDVDSSAFHHTTDESSKVDLDKLRVMKALRETTSFMSEHRLSMEFENLLMVETPCGSHSAIKKLSHMLRSNRF